MIKRRTEFDRFRAVTDDGRETTLIVLQEFLDAGTFRNPNAEILGLKAIKTIDGFAVNSKGDDTYEIVNDPINPSLIVHRA